MLEQIQAWLSSLPGTVVIQTRSNGQVIVAIQNGSMSAMAIRPTFVEAAEACMHQANCVATKKNR